jgi:hypothetical protein
MVFCMAWRIAVSILHDVFGPAVIVAACVAVEVGFSHHDGWRFHRALRDDPDPLVDENRLLRSYLTQLPKGYFDRTSLVGDGVPNHRSLAQCTSGVSRSTALLLREGYGVHAPLNSGR